MAIATYAAYKAKIAAPYQRLWQQKSQFSSDAVFPFSSLWTSVPFPGVAPTTAAVPTRATAGALGQQNSAGVQRLANIEMSGTQLSILVLADRLSHQGGLDGTSVAAQTTNLPTAALTRYTTGEGVWMAFEIYTALGATGTTLTVSYTNQAGTAGKISIATLIGGSGYNAANKFRILPLADGDTGVRSVESVTLAASTLTVGNFGITLFKPLLIIPVPVIGQLQSFNGLLNNGCDIPQIVDNACLFWFGNNQNGFSIAAHSTTFKFIEE